MNLTIKWNKPIALDKTKNDELGYSLKSDKVPDSAGIYIFGRRYGTSYEALYVGKSINLRKRVEQHLNNLKLMKHLEKAKNGERILITGLIMPLPGQKSENIMNILERAFIRHFIEMGHDLVNMQGVSIKRHEINSEGPIKKSFIPSKLYLEQG